MCVQNVADPVFLPELFPKHFMHQTINYFRNNNKKDDLRKTLYDFFENIRKTASNSDVSRKTKVAIIKKLLFWPGNFMFEKITKTKLVQQVTLALDTEGLKKLVKMYKKIVLAQTEKTKDDNTTEKWSNADRIYAAQLITKLLGNSRLVDDMDYRIEQLTFFVEIALFKNEHIENSLHGIFKETFFNSLNQKIYTLDNLSNILSSLVGSIAPKVENDEIRKPLLDDEKEIWRKTVETVEKIEKKTKTKSLHTVFRVLFLLMGLQLFNEPKMAIDYLNELFLCYERTRRTKNDDSNPEEPLWIEVVIELFLNMLSNNSHFLRRVVNCVFPHLCKFMNATVIQQILSVLDPKSDSVLVDKDEDTSEDDEGDDEDMKSASSEDDGDEEEMEIGKFSQIFQFVFHVDK